MFYIEKIVTLNTLIAFFILVSASAMLHASDKPVVFGKLNLAYQHTGDDSGEYWALINNASRFGVKGESMTDFNAKVIYQIEISVKADGVEDGQSFLTPRNTFIGLQGHYGKLIVGRMDTPTKSAGNKFDLPNDLVSDLRMVMAGENRENKIVRFTSNKISNLTYDLAIKTLHESGESAVNQSDYGYSTSINYSPEWGYFIISVDSNIQSQDIHRLVTGFNIVDSLAVNILYQKAEKREGSLFKGDLKKSESAAVNLIYSVGKMNTRIQYATSQTNDRFEDGRQLTTVFQYALSGQSKMYAYLSELRAQNGEINYSGIGLEHKF